jgi:hypothetical protein
VSLIEIGDYLSFVIERDLHAAILKHYFSIRERFRYKSLCCYASVNPLEQPAIPVTLLFDIGSLTAAKAALMGATSLTLGKLTSN